MKNYPLKDFTDYVLAFYSGICALIIAYLQCQESGLFQAQQASQLQGFEGGESRIPLPVQSAPPQPSVPPPLGQQVVQPPPPASAHQPSVPQVPTPQGAVVRPAAPSDPAQWTIEQVVAQMSYLDPTLGPHVEMFR